ncbi:MAG: hypothetical protein PVF69_07055 [Gemmatimonadota bacterium]
MADEYGLAYREDPDRSDVYLWQSRVSLALGYVEGQGVTFTLSQLGKNWRPESQEVLNALQDAIETGLGVSCVEQIADENFTSRTAVFTCASR